MNGGCVGISDVPHCKTAYGDYNNSDEDPYGILHKGIRFIVTVFLALIIFMTFIM